MEELFRENGIIIDKVKAEKFEKFSNLLIEYNKKFNLTAITDKEEIYKKHFIDSIKGKDLLCGKVLDIGAGGGFPSIPLKIIKEDLEFTLLDATEKKCEFLNIVIKELELKNIKVICGRAEEIAKNLIYREKFDCVVSRAVARLNVLSEYALPFIKVGGKFIAYKGDGEQEIIESENAIKVLGGKIKNINNFDFYGAKRCLIEIEKIKKTDMKYPRVNAKIKKSPL